MHLQAAASAVRVAHEFSGRIAQMQPLMVAGKVLSFMTATVGTLLFFRDPHVMSVVAQAAPVAGSPSWIEHVDLAEKLVALLVIALGFWTQRWIARREAFETAVMKRIDSHESVIIQLTESHKNQSDSCFVKMNEAERTVRRQEEFRMWVAMALSAIASRSGVELPHLPEERVDLSIHQGSEKA